LSGDGALIAFSSGLADNFAGSSTTSALVLRDINAGTLTAVSVNDGGGAQLGRGALLRPSRRFP